MRLISSKNTNIIKRVVVPLGFLFMMSVGTGMINQVDSENIEDLIFPISFIVFMIFVLVIAQIQLLTKYADEVYDCGDFLRIKHGKRNAKIFLHDIINLNLSRDKSDNKSIEIYSSNRIYNNLSTKKISFIPNRDTMLPNVQSYVDSLIERIDKARKKDIKDY